MSGWQRIKSLWVNRPKLSGAPPFVFLLTYIAVIFVFGAAYTSLPPPAFYAPYARYESPAKEDADQVAADLFDMVENSIRRSSAPQNRNDWQIDPTSIGVSDVSIDADNQLIFTVRFRAWNRDQTASVLGWSFHAVAGLRERMITSTAKGIFVTRLIRTEVKPNVYLSALNVSDEKFAAQLFKASDPILLVPGLSWDKDTERRLWAFARGRQGDPAAISGQFWRMIYFSSTTITTVGFGDIVPLTTLARLLVAIEAVLGWTLAGFFLNAVAHRLRENKYG